jgi:hypothetical protein
MWMLSAALLALVFGLPADAQTSPAVAPEVPPPSIRWTENWAVSLSTGRSFHSSPSDSSSGSMWQASHRQSEIRVTHQGAPLVIGAALHRVAYPDGPALYAIGAGLVLGAQHLLQPWLHAEFDGTLGLQRPYYAVAPMAALPDAGGASNAGNDYYYYVESGSLELYARLAAGVALRVTSWLDIPMRLTLHMHPVGETHSLWAVSVGLRCLVP